jgi:hypothetical protein
MSTSNLVEYENAVLLTDVLNIWRGGLLLLIVHMINSVKQIGRGGMFWNGSNTIKYEPEGN